MDISEARRTSLKPKFKETYSVADVERIERKWKVMVEWKEERVKHGDSRGRLPSKVAKRYRKSMEFQ